MHSKAESIIPLALDIWLPFVPELPDFHFSDISRFHRTPTFSITFLPPFSKSKVADEFLSKLCIHIGRHICCVFA